MKDESKIQDIRSTGRRIARRTLFNSREPYKCAGVPELNIVCGKTSMEPPKDAPSFFDEIWPEDNRVLGYPLQADHESKDLWNNDLQHINWRCQPCHKKHDNMSEKGESTMKSKDLF